MRNLVIAILSVCLGWGTTHLTGCASTEKKIESFSDPHDDAKLSDCRGEGRAYFQTSEGKTKEDAERAYSIYQACVCDAGYCKDGGK